MHNELVNISPHEPSDDCAEMAERDDGPSKMLARPGCADIALVRRRDYCRLRSLRPESESRLWRWIALI